jgi:DNA replication initiation complex subunit (GINS family)
MLTFETLSRIAREEKSSSSLTKLPDGFFEEVSSYITKKTQARQGDEDAWELESAKMAVNDILRAREKKLLMSSLVFVETGVEPANLADEEKAFFEQVSSIVGRFRERKKGSMEMHDRKAMVTFTEDVPVFVWTDMKNYGPFNKNDVANLPEGLTKFLVGKGAAKPISVASEAI